MFLLIKKLEIKVTSSFTTKNDQGRKLVHEKNIYLPVQSGLKKVNRILKLLIVLKQNIERFTIFQIETKLIH